MVDRDSLRKDSNVDTGRWLNTLVPLADILVKLKSRRRIQGRWNSTVGDNDMWRTCEERRVLSLVRSP